MNGASQNTIKISGKQMINIYRDVLLGYIYEDDLVIDNRRVREERGGFNQTAILT